MFHLIRIENNLKEHGLFKNIYIFVKRLRYPLTLPIHEGSNCAILSLSLHSTKFIFLLRKISLFIRRFNVDYVLGYQNNDKASAGGGWEGKKKRSQPRESDFSAEFRPKRNTKQVCTFRASALRVELF